MAYQTEITIYEGTKFDGECVSPKTVKKIEKFNTDDLQVEVEIQRIRDVMDTKPKLRFKKMGRHLQVLSNLAKELVEYWNEHKWVRSYLGNEFSGEEPFMDLNEPLINSIVDTSNKYNEIYIGLGGETFNWGYRTDAGKITKKNIGYQDKAYVYGMYLDIMKTIKSLY